MEKLSKQKQDQIMTALGRVITATNTGVDPSAAIAKEAAAEGFSLEVAQRMKDAFNTSAAIHHRENNSGTARKEDFPLADGTKIASIMFPEQVQTPAVQKQASIDLSSAMLGEVNFMKAAATTVHDISAIGPKPAPLPRLPEEEAIQAFGRIKRARNKLDATKQQYRDSWMSMMNSVQKAANYFRRVGHTEKFADVERRTLGQFGDIATDLIAAIHQAAGGYEKRGSYDGSTVVFDTSKEPYCYIADAVDAANAAVKEAEMSVAAEQEVDLLVKKSIAGGRYMAGALGGLAAAAVGVDSGDKSTLYAQTRQKTLDEFFNPEMDMERRKVNAITMLNDFMTNDDVISSQDPDKVIAMFNKISELTPAVALQPAVMQGLLRRMLTQETMEPFDAKQLAEIEKELRRSSLIT